MYTLMIVDDEKTIRESLPFAVDFEQYGFTVCATAKNGEDAWEKLCRQRPDVILLDVCMPVLDGLGFLKKLHEEKGQPVPAVVMLSGYSDFEYARTAMRYGVKAYLTKPLDEDEMMQILTEVRRELDSTRKKRENELLRDRIRSLQKMYHDGDGDRSAYEDCLLMHCVVLHARGQDGIYEGIRECVEKELPEGRAVFFRSRGSIFSFLLRRSVLEEYQHSVTLLARHLLYHIKKAGAECALLFDEGLFLEGRGTFRTDHDANLYRMLTEVFWKGERVLQHRKGEPEDSAGGVLEQEDVLLESIKDAFRQLDRTKLSETFETMVGRMERDCLDIACVHKISYRVYYALTDLLRDMQEEADIPAPKPLDFRDAPCFSGFSEWKDALWNQLSEAFSYLERAGAGKQAGDRVIVWIRQHFREQISLKEAADQLFMSTAYLGRCVQKAAGMSFKQYVNELRMEEARRLLRQTDRLIYEIAEEVGFKESKYFVSKFTAETGMTPLEYRKANGEQYLHKKQ